MRAFFQELEEEEMKKQDGLPRDARITYRFKTKPFDFMFQWILGSCSGGGAEIGEAMYIASHIREGNGEDWYREFTAMGNRVLSRAENSEKHGHKLSASDAFLRGYIYFRSAPLFLNPRTDKRYKASYEAARNWFRRGIELRSMEAETIEIPFEEGLLPGYIFKPDDRLDAGKTLIMIGGGDTFVEDLYFYIGPSAFRRGYQLVMVDLPGQGPLPWEGLYFPVEAEASIGVLIDELEKRGDIHTEKLGLYGISGGGYLTPRSASKDKRIKAVAACSVILDLNTLWTRKLLNLHKSLPGKIMKLLKPDTYRSFINLVETYRWRWGARNNDELLINSEPMKFNPEEIKCPLLNLVAEQEYFQFPPTQNAAEHCLKAVKDSTLLITPADEGADSHAVGTNIHLMSQLLFDWMDEKLT